MITELKISQSDLSEKRKEESESEPIYTIASIVHFYDLSSMALTFEDTMVSPTPLYLIRIIGFYHQYLWGTFLIFWHPSCNLA
jgi:hypothetical protein